MTRDERLEWCKQRAREYLAQGDLTNAVASMISDMNQKYPGLPPCPLELAMIGIMTAAQADQTGVSAWVEGFN
jgi:hypothetical protein